MAEPVSASEELAMRYAFEVHAHQQWGPHPYSEHLRRVHALCTELALGPEVCTAAWLHDSLEDSSKPVPAHRQELTQRFGAQVSRLVFSVSGFGARRSERCADIVSKLWSEVREADKSRASQSVAAVSLKMADRWVNWSMASQGTDSASRKLCKLFAKEFDEHYRFLLPFAHPELQRKMLELSQESHRS